MALDYLDSIRRDARGFAEAARAAGPDVAIETCPGWDMADLVWHLREVHYDWGTVVERRLQDPRQVPPIARPDTFAAVLDQFAAGAERMIEAFRDADPATPVWTWATQQDVAFVVRHQAQEAAVHRFDAEHAAGREYAVDPAIAADAIDEFLEFSAPDRFEDAAPLGGSVHLHATDTDGEWAIAEDEDRRLRVSREHAKADAAARATASDLLLMLYRRVGPERAEVFGDRAVLDRLLARTDLT